MEAMRAALRFVLLWGGFLAVILIPIWPLLALAAGTWSQGMGCLSALAFCLSPIIRFRHLSCAVCPMAHILSLEWSRLSSSRWCSNRALSKPVHVHHLMPCA